MILKISGNIYSTIVAKTQKFHKCMCNTSRDVIREDPLEDPVEYITIIFKCKNWLFRLTKSIIQKSRTDPFS